MRAIYHPKPGEQVASPGRALLWLGDEESEGLLFELSGERAHVKLFPSPKSKGWVARIEGVDESWVPERIFCKGEWRHDEGWQVDRRLEFYLEPGLYEAECMMYAPQVEREGPHRLYFSFAKAEGIKLLSRVQFFARLGAMCDVSFGEVRALIARGRWAEAERAACLIEDDKQRQEATYYVTEYRARWEQSLPGLEGSVRQVQWASSLRQRALSAFRAYGAQFSGDEGPARSELERAHQWFVTRTKARFWIDHRDTLQGAQLWELYLKQQVDD